MTVGDLKAFLATLPPELDRAPVCVGRWEETTRILSWAHARVDHLYSFEFADNAVLLDTGGPGLPPEGVAAGIRVLHVKLTPTPPDGSDLPDPLPDAA